MKTERILLAGVWICILTLSACSPAPMVEDFDSETSPVSTQSSEDTAAGAPTEALAASTGVLPLSIESLRNASLSSPVEAGRLITLVNGRYVGEPFVAGGASRPEITLLEPVAFGDLDQDGMNEAAAVIVSNTGGSGSFYTLEIFDNQGGSPAQMASFDLGDRIKIRGIGIQKGTIFIESVIPAEGESISQPTLLTLSSYALANGQINMTNTRTLGSVAGQNSEVALSDIADISWQWVAYLDNNETGSFGVESPASYTLTLTDDGTYQLLADCNYVSGTYQTAGPSQIEFMPGATTLQACGEGSRDAEYLQKLGDVRTFVLADGQLHLNLMLDAGNLVFEPMPRLLNTAEMSIP